MRVVRMLPTIFVLSMLIGCSGATDHGLVIGRDKQQLLTNGYQVALLPFKESITRPQSFMGEVEIPPNAGEVVIKYIEQELLRSSRFRVIDRENLARVIEEQKLSASGLTDRAVEIGKLLNADGIIVGDILEATTIRKGVPFMGRATFMLKLIDVKSGQLVFTFEAKEQVSMATCFEAMKKGAEKFGAELARLR